MEEIRKYTETFLNGQEATRVLENLLQYKAEGIKVKVLENGNIFFPQAHGKVGVVHNLPAGDEILVYPEKDKEGNAYLRGRGVFNHIPTPRI